MQPQVSDENIVLIDHLQELHNCKLLQRAILCVFVSGGLVD